MQLEGLVDGVQLLHRGVESGDTNPSYDEYMMGGHAVGFDAANRLSNSDDSTGGEVVMYVRRTTTAVVIKCNAEREGRCSAAHNRAGALESVGKFETGVATCWNGFALSFWSFGRGEFQANNSWSLKGP